MAEISSQMAEPDFWLDEQKSARVVKELKSLKLIVEPWENSGKKLSELKEFYDLLKDNEQSDLVSELQDNLNVLEKEVGSLEFKTLLNGEVDANNAILSINAGAGGTESCDWVGMLLRMYMRWAEIKGYKVKTLDILPGEEAGVKNVTLLIEGEYAFGYSKAERGVHRLVRISPFDANKRRHTSFASVDVIPEIEDMQIKLDDKELVVETFRASSAGGQHMQKTESAVRITHLPSGIVAQSQNERSQQQNKQTAMKILQGRVYDYEQQKRELELQKHSVEKKKIEWGSQIRSYVLHPYNLVKDHRTEHETGNTNAVMDGKLDEFIEAFLKMQAKGKG
jgi:peptide chain release factor 2